MALGDEGTTVMIIQHSFFIYIDCFKKYANKVFRL